MHLLYFIRLEEFVKYGADYMRKAINEGAEGLPRGDGWNVDLGNRSARGLDLRKQFPPVPPGICHRIFFPVGRRGLGVCRLFAGRVGV